MNEHSIQDLDLLARIGRYLDDIEERVRQGCGWFIFGATPARSNRIQHLLVQRLSALQPLISFYFLPWRDFSLNAYLLSHELKPRVGSGIVVPEHLEQREFELANRVSQDMHYQMRFRELLIVAPVRPERDHEVAQLASLVEERFQKRLATILISPLSLPVLAGTTSALNGGEAAWKQIYSRMYESSLFAV